MLYQAYQTQSDLMFPAPDVRLMHTSALLGAGRSVLASAPSPFEGMAQCCNKLSAASFDVFSPGMRLTHAHARPMVPAHRWTVGGTARFAVTEHKVLRDCRSAPCCISRKIRPCDLPFQPRGAAGGAAVGALRHAAARNRAHAAAGPRRVHHRLAQRARCEPCARAVFAGRLHRLHDLVPQRHWARRARGGSVPALRGGACRHSHHGRRRQPGAAAQPDTDGRPGGLPRQPDRA